MRCAEVKARLIEQSGPLSIDNLPPELSQHIAKCDNCAREAQALGLLANSLNTVRVENFNTDIPITAMRTRLTSGSKQKNRSTRWFGLATGIPAVAIALAVLAITFWPNAPQHQFEYSVAISGLERELAEDSDLICDLLMNIGLSDADIKQVECQLTCELEVVHLQSQSEIDRLVNALAQINSIELETNIKTVPKRNGV